MSAAEFTAVLTRLEAVADRLDGGAKVGAGGGGAAQASGGADPAVALAFDAFLQGTAGINALQAAAAGLGVQDVTEATEMFAQACGLLRDILAATGRCQKPKDADWATILKPVMDLGQKAQKACDNRSDFFQNRKAVAEALNICMLVTNASPPMFVQNVLETMDFHATKVMMKKVEKETAWIKALKSIVASLKEWCAENCKLGLSWANTGEEATAYFAARPLGSGGAPNATAPAKPKAQGYGGDAGGAGGAGMAGIMGAISGGLAVTGGLKKVTDDLKTKNRPKDDQPPPVAPKATLEKRASFNAGVRGKGPRGPPVLELQRGINWTVENQEGNSALKLEDVDKSQLVCIINCKNCTVQIGARVKSVCIDGCEKVNVVMQDVISTVELVNCDRCQVQTTGVVNSFAIDKCNGINVFLSKESMHAELITSKSSEMNVTVPDGDDGDQIEMPIPEQFVTTIADVGKRKLKTGVSGIYS